MEPNPSNMIIVQPHVGIHTSALNFSARATLHRRYASRNSRPVCILRAFRVRARDSRVKRCVVRARSGTTDEPKIRGCPLSRGTCRLVVLEKKPISTSRVKVGSRGGQVSNTRGFYGVSLLDDKGGSLVERGQRSTRVRNDSNETC